MLGKKLSELRSPVIILFSASILNYLLKNKANKKAGVHRNIFKVDNGETDLRMPATMLTKSEPQDDRFIQTYFSGHVLANTFSIFTNQDSQVTPKVARVRR